MTGGQSVVVAWVPEIHRLLYTSFLESGAVSVLAIVQAGHLIQRFFSATRRSGQSMQRL